VAADDQLQPNLFRLQGDGTEVIYSTTSITGQPDFSYTGPQGQKQFTGDEIRTCDTELGTEVTVTLNQIADGDTKLFTVLLPAIELDERAAVPIETWGITTTKASSIAGPPPGQQDSYAVSPLAGEASFAEF
jgi:hypothetical protein